MVTSVTVYLTPDRGNYLYEKLSRKENMESYAVVLGRSEAAGKGHS